MRSFTTLLLVAVIAGSSGCYALASTDESNSQQADLSALENRLFFHDYHDEAVEQRLERMEAAVFGQAKNGSSQERIAGLVRAVPARPSASQETARSAGDPYAAPNQNAQALENEYRQNSSNDARAFGQSKLNSFDQQPVDGADYYPTVTALEQQMLGRTCVSLPVQERVAQLESKAFGKPSDAEDLSARVELLQQQLRVQNGSDNNYIDKAPPPAATESTSPRLSLDQRISSFETDTFGKTYAREKIVNRLNRLEKTLFPGQPPQKFAPVPWRVQRIADSITHPLSPTAGSTAVSANTQTESKPPLLKQTAQYYPSYLGSEGQVAAANGAAASTGNNNTTQTKAKGHPALRNVGTVLGGVGMVAASVAMRVAASRMMYGGYGGYNGYGGYSGYGSYGGMRNLGFGGLGALGGLGYYGGYGGFGGYGGYGGYGYSPLGSILGRL